MESKNDFEFLLRALANELTVDEYFYSGLKQSAKNYGWFPKVTRVNAKIDIKKIGLVLRFLWLVWPFLSFFFNIYCLVKYSFSKAIAGIKVEQGSSENLFFASSESAVNIYKKASNKSVFVLTRPSFISNQPNGPVSSLGVVSYLQLFWIFLQSNWFSWRIFIGHFRGFRVSTYMIFEMLVVKKAISNLFAIHEFRTISCVDHYDRWAVLVDFFIDSYEKKIAFEIVQHGKLSNGINVNDLGFSMNLPYRLRNVSLIYYFENVAISLFKEYILDKKSCCKFVKFSNKISLVDFNLRGFKILIIGHPLCFGFHVDLARTVLVDSDMVLFYKPHPTQKYSGSDLDSRWILINKDYEFPKVDLVISYNSTLADQYSEHGIPILKHDFSPSDEDLNNIVSGLLNKVYKNA